MKTFRVGWIHTLTTFNIISTPASVLERISHLISYLITNFLPDFIAKLSLHHRFNLQNNQNASFELFLTNSMELSLSSETNIHSATQEIPRLVWNQRFITEFTTARHMSLSWARWIPTTTLYSISLRWISLLSPHVLNGFPPSSFPYLPWELHDPPISSSLI